MDYRKLAEDELRHVEELRAAEKICRDRLSDLTDQLHTTKVPSPQSDPVHGGGSKIEDRWLNIIALKMDEEKRLRNVRRRTRRRQYCAANGKNTAAGYQGERSKKF